MTLDSGANGGGSPFGVFAEWVRSGRLVWRLLRDHRVGLAAKLIVPSLAGIYLVWPVDLLPDWLIGLGQLDDLALLLLGAHLFVRMCPPDVVREHLDALRRGSSAVTGGDAEDAETVDGEYRIIE